MYYTYKVVGLFYYGICQGLMVPHVYGLIMVMVCSTNVYGLIMVVVYSTNVYGLIMVVVCSTIVYGMVMAVVCSTEIMTWLWYVPPGLVS